MKTDNMTLPITNSNDTAIALHEFIIRKSNELKCRHVVLSPSLISLLSATISSRYEILEAYAIFPSPYSPRLRFRGSDLTLYWNIYADDHYIEFFKDISKESKLKI
jgi:hypothetical protein